MLNKIREQEILNILRVQGGFVTTKSLCEQLYASESSIRRDLKSLELKGLVRRAYGGAEPIESNQNIVTFNHRTRQNESEKREIAKKAINLIHDGDLIFLDQSSTAFFLAAELKKKNLTVITNSISILTLLSDSNIHSISSGGYLSESNKMCLIGGDANETFKNSFANIAFFSARSISTDGIISDYDREEIIVRNTMLRNAKIKVFLCDSSKYDTVGKYKQCELADIDYMISEGDKSKRFSEISDKVIFL